MDKSAYGNDSKPLGNHPKPPKSSGRPRSQGPREPKRLQVKKRVLGKWKTHPVDKMVKIANFIEPSNPELAAKIWIRLLDSCELEEKTKKGYLPPAVVNETPSEIEALKALEAAENGESTTQSDSNSLATGKTDLQAETSPTANISVDSGK